MSGDSKSAFGPVRAALLTGMLLWQQRVAGSTVHHKQRLQPQNARVLACLACVSCKSAMCDAPIPYLRSPTVRLARRRPFHIMQRIC